MSASKVQQGIVLKLIQISSAGFRHAWPSRVFLVGRLANGLLRILLKPDHTFGMTHSTMDVLPGILMLFSFHTEGVGVPVNTLN